MHNHEDKINAVLSVEQLRVFIRLESRIAEFQNTDLLSAQNNLQNAEQQRQAAIAVVNQVQGAITGGRIMLQKELEHAGVSPEEYEHQKSEYLAEIAKLGSEPTINETHDQE